MLAMSEVNCIKTLRNEKGLSISQIADTLDINWRTAKKYGDGDQLPQEKTFLKKRMMYEERWGEIVLDWLEEDSKVKKKLRRTNKQMHEELVALGFPGSYRTVCDFIVNCKAARDDEQSKGYERLAHPEGEAQVDFGVMEAVHEGEIVDVHALIMSFPASNTGFVVPLPSENQECFLSGLKLLFKQAGGIPLSIRIDNLTPAVKKVRGSEGEAQLTDEFMAFKNHYGFKVQVCNPRSGHEKGNVERKVGYVRYNFFSVPPVIKDFDDLTEQLYQKFLIDRKRMHYRKEAIIEDLWACEQKQLLKLPDNDYSVFKQTTIKFNKYNEFKLDQHLIHVPKAKNYSQLYCITFWNEFKVITNEGEVLLSDARPYMRKRRLIPWKDILKDWVYKPRVVGHSRYREYLPARVREYLLTPSLSLRKQRINEIITLLVQYDMKGINEQFYELISKNDEVVSNPYDVEWSQYDALQPIGGVNHEGNH
ncbi:MULTISPECIES: IS21 family transposase [Ureibacillus]|uniref:Transposase n=2 Tax=Ureibacillus TaxID=160795 RepID=A0A0A3INA4_9BACL|nr:MULTISPECIES: IS21 family transposase [Ureibacillus]KGR86236.1 transposase [Ureibacillus massiliensis 4400831 = CIP 108448 = CCUG 49529]PYF01852.1 transposase [Ureibacillus chungkukjangi]